MSVVQFGDRQSLQTIYTAKNNNNLSQHSNNMISDLPFQGISLRPKSNAHILLAELMPSDVHIWGLYFVRETYIGQTSMRARELNQRLLSEGAYVIDQREIHPNEIITARYAGPVPSINLPPLTIERGNNNKITFESYQQAFEHDITLKSMTMISLDLYAQMWRALRARIGRVIAGQIIWNLNQGIGSA